MARNNGTAARPRAGAAAPAKDLNLKQILESGKITRLNLIDMTAKGNPIFENPDNEEQSAPVAVGLLRYYLEKELVTTDGNDIICEAGFKLSKNTWQPARNWDNTEL